MKQMGSDTLQGFEIHLFEVVSKCEFQYGGSGLTGFLYESVKDQLSWGGLEVKHYVGFIMEIGRYLVMKDEDFTKVMSPSVNISEMSADDINKFVGV